MSYSEFLEWGIETGCGWLGWTPEQVRFVHLRDLMLAIEGKRKMLQACFGSGEPEKETKPVKKSFKTAEDFDKYFGVR